MTDFNIGHIAQLARLEVLDLGETSVSDRGIAELARLKNLHTLDLRATRVTGKGIAALSRPAEAAASEALEGQGHRRRGGPRLPADGEPGGPRTAGDEHHREGAGAAFGEAGLETALHRRHRHHAGAGRGAPRGLAGLPGELVEEAARSPEPGRAAGGNRRAARRTAPDDSTSDDLGSFFSPVGKPPIGAPTTSSARVRYRSPTVPVTPRVEPGLHPARMARGDHGQAGVLVRIGLGVLVDVQRAGVVEQRARRPPGST